ncbi:MAG: hypothetical protein ACHQET_09710 [Chitinophagales bacterium]
MRKFMFYLAFSGWILALAFTLLTFANIEVTEKLPLVWLMHTGVLVVWIFVMIILWKNKQESTMPQPERQPKLNTFKKINRYLKNAPLWLRTLAITSIAFMFVNFFLFMLTQHGSPAIMKGEYILHGPGNVIRILTEKEYLHFRANELRGFSGIWFGFYGLASAILYPLKFSNALSK